MAENTKAQITQLDGAAWIENLVAMRNAYGAYEEFGDIDGMRSAFDSALDAAYGLVVASRPDVPLRAPWQPGEVYARPGHYTGVDDD